MNLLSRFRVHENSAMKAHVVAQLGKLTIVPTPLGNLGDMTPRSRDALAACDAVCCEDTRVTGRLLSALGIQVRLERLDEATITHAAPRVVRRILDGERICYCSDAGMPGVSDPGQRLVDAAYEAGAPVEVLPGGTAVATAYVASGFTAQNFYFGSFFPRKEGQRERLLEQLGALDAVLVFYESPQRVVSALASVARAFPTRRVAVCRELTKLHEEVVRGRASEVASEFGRRAQSAPIKGEIVLVIDAPTEQEREQGERGKLEQAAERADELRAEGRLSGKEMVSLLRSEFGISRNEAYALAHATGRVSGVGEAGNAVRSTDAHSAISSDDMGEETGRGTV